jgi:hypothetical protein
MHTSVPQYIDVEDKLAFGLTARQLGWLGVMLVSLLVIYALFDRQAFYIFGFFVVLFFLLLTFWRPEGVSLLTFLGFMLQHFFHPRSYVWKRVYHESTFDVRKASLAQKKKMTFTAAPKNLPSANRLRKIAWELDTKKIV